MTHQLIKAHLNLHAVLQNLEDLVEHDPQTAALAEDWRISVQFTVKKGPRAFISFADGACQVGPGKCRRPSVILYFKSPEHLNRMMDGTANPIPLKGMTRLPFLAKEFPRATDRLEHFLKPTDELLADPDYLALNTRFSLSTAVFAVRELCLLDEVGQLNAAHIPKGTVLFKVLPDGPAMHLVFQRGDIEVVKGEAKQPSAVMLFKNQQVANDLLNGKGDAFTAIAAEDVMIRGRIPMIEAINPILDRIPLYLS